jgi:ADP-dependent NAD(P)H-hydrate dehydratase / NAD(P)H-hydrate epimerase
MTELLTSAQMRAIEAAAIASGAVTGLELMERAGRGVVEAVFAEWPELAAGTFRAVVLCGPGNNGGDGFVVARLLKEWGWEVEVLLYGDAEKLPTDARVNYERWMGLGEVAPLVDQPLGRGLDEGKAALRPALLLDAVFGIGLSRPIDGLLGLWRSSETEMRAAGGRVVAVDVPSGLCADSGRTLGGGACSADLTVTFHRMKLGHVLAEGAARCGRVAVVDIGLERTAKERVIKDVVRVVTREQIQQVSAVTDPPFLLGQKALSKGKAPVPVIHKYTFGHALVLSGGVGRGGAARMAARAALRVGAGLVTLGCPQDAVVENAGRLDAVMLRSVNNGAELAEVLIDDRIRTLCLGPGLGVDARGAELVSVGLGVGDPAARWARRLVLDADALTILSQNQAWFDALHDDCVLTPHGGEFARLFPDIAGKLKASAATGPAYSKVDATREAAARAGCVVLFKGADTVIAAPDGRCSVHPAVYDRAAPWLATAGSGDVLAGLIAGLMARSFYPMQAAETAAWLHVECARSFGPGLIAEDLPEELPKVFRALGL